MMKGNRAGCIFQRNSCKKNQTSWKSPSLYRWLRQFLQLNARSFVNDQIGKRLLHQLICAEIWYLSASIFWLPSCTHTSSYFGPGWQRVGDVLQIPLRIIDLIPCFLDRLLATCAVQMMIVAMVCLLLLILYDNKLNWTPPTRCPTHCTLQPVQLPGICSECPQVM